MGIEEMMNRFRHKRLLAAKTPEQPVASDLPTARMVAVASLKANELGFPVGVGQAVAHAADGIVASEKYLEELAEGYAAILANCQANNEPGPSIDDAAELIKDGATVKAVLWSMSAEIDERKPAYGAPRTENVVLNSWDHGKGFEAKLIDGLRARMNPKHEPTIGREFSGHSLAEMAMAAAQISGQRVGSQREAIDMIFRPAMSGTHTRSDFTRILSGTVGQEMADHYVQQQPAVFETSREIPAPDFRQRVRPRLSTGPELTKVNEAGEIKYGAFEETGETAPQLETYAKIFGVSRKAIVDDNLGALADIPREMARGAITTSRNLMLAPLLANSGNGQTMLETGSTLFHADHGNLAASGGALSVTSLTEAVVGMRRQRGLVEEVIDIRPWAIVVPPEQETVALQVVAEITPETVSEVNPFSGRLRVIVEPGLSDTEAWYVVADPRVTEGLMHSYLDGEAGPRVEDMPGWHTDTIEWRCIMDFGASFVDYRGWFKNPG